ncbi:MAG: hypothetical protein K2P14_06215, partial [Anaeroplasmataceae bacterium]|nr:hypothetical protein [Anaeroplasmataceae bacterium]
LLRRTDKTSMDLLAIPAFVVLILFEYNGWTYLSKILDSKISNFLGSLSLGMYLNQNLIIGYYIRTFRGTLYFVDSLCFIAFLSMFSFFIFNIKKILIQTLRYIRKVK